MCAGTTLTATGSASTDPEGGSVTYEYQFRQTNSSGTLHQDWSSTATLSTSSYGGQTIWVGCRATDGNSNSSTTSTTATVTATPNAGTLSGTQSICSTGSTTFTTDGDSGGAWTSGTTGVATIDASTGAISPQSAGSSTITYTVSASPCTMQLLLE